MGRNKIVNAAAVPSPPSQKRNIWPSCSKDGKVDGSQAKYENGENEKMKCKK